MDGFDVVVEEIGGARDARYVPEVEEYDGRYDDGVIELNFVVGAVELGVDEASEPN